MEFIESNIEGCTLLDHMLHKLYYNIYKSIEADKTSSWNNITSKYFQTVCLLWM